VRAVATSPCGDDDAQAASLCAQLGLQLDAAIHPAARARTWPLGSMALGMMLMLLALLLLLYYL
jgi:hypothetical protein